jgi:predicted dehydrogenase
MSVSGVDHRAPDGVPAHDYRMLSLDFSHDADAGPVAQVSYGSYISERWPEAISFRPPAQLQVCCQRGIAFVDLPTTLIWFDEAGRHQESLDNERPVGEQLLMRFHRAVTSLVRKRDDLEDTYRAIRVVLAASQSAREGRRIPLSGGDASSTSASP